MIEFYSWTQVERTFVTLLIAFCVIVQTLATVLRYYQRPHPRLRLFENLLELFLLLHIIVLSLLMGEAQLGHFSGLIVPTGYVAMRYISTACVGVVACIAMIYTKKAWYLVIICVSCLTLPFMETICGNAYAWIYIGALAFWLIRGTYIFVTQYRKINANISALSVKSAIDSLHTGILFSEQDGLIALANVQMQRLMVEFTGRIYRNSQHFYERLVAKELLPGCRVEEHEGQLVCLLPDGKAWVFTRMEMKVKNKQYIQLTATDITERWALTTELRKQEELLIIRGEELREMIMGLQKLSKAREFQNAKLRAHDILGQRLTMLLYGVNSGQELDYDLLCAQLQRLLDDLKSDHITASPQEKLDNLHQTFKTIDVEIYFDGKLPEEDVKGYLFVDIIGESVVNAVRHGFASKVFIKVDCVEDVWYLEITDNGYSSFQPIKEGSGISGMRGKAEQQGGTLVVTNYPYFILKVELPGGQKDV